MAKKMNFECDKIIYIGLFILLCIWVYQTFFKKYNYFENNNDENDENKYSPIIQNNNNNNVENIVEEENVYNSNCNRNTITAEELLPQEVSDFNDANPIGEGIYRGINYLDAGYHVGVNTVGQSLRNANRQLRSEPANPQVAVSPWMMSTIGPDLLRQPLDSNCGN
jgi:hypothetical protein